MLSPFSCAFFHPEDVHDDEQPMSLSPCSTPRKSSASRRKGSNSKNPYSTRGLDKFSALLADLEEKRQKIYAQNNPQDISFVRFVYNNSDDCVPIVVKLKDKKDQLDKTKPELLDQIKEKHVTEACDKFGIESSKAKKEVHQQQPGKTKKLMNMLWRRPSYYLPVVVILILVLLAVFGRSVAILCTCIGWYAVPTLKAAESSNARRGSKKKDHKRRLSDNKMVVTEGLSSPKSNNNTTTTTTTPRSRQHGHDRKSW